MISMHTIASPGQSVTSARPALNSENCTRPLKPGSICNCARDQVRHGASRGCTETGHVIARKCDLFARADDDQLARLQPIAARRRQIEALAAARRREMVQRQLDRGPAHPRPIERIDAGNGVLDPAQNLLPDEDAGWPRTTCGCALHGERSLQPIIGAASGDAGEFARHRARNRQPVGDDVVDRLARDAERVRKRSLVEAEPLHFGAEMLTWRADGCAGCPFPRLRRHGRSPPVRLRHGSSCATADYRRTLYNLRGLKKA